MRRVIFVVLLALPVVVGTAVAQSVRPDYSGTWTIDLEHSESAVNGYDFPSTIIARQTASDLIVKSERGHTTETLLYDLHGSQTTLPGDVTTSLHWSGTSIIAKTTRRISGWAATLEETWELDAQRSRLTIVKAVNVQHGYERASPTPTTYERVKDVFVRTQKP